MKKIIAISVMFVLLTGAVFADVNFGGGAGMGTQIIFGSTEKDANDETAPLQTGGWRAHWGSFSGTWTSEDNSAGGKFKMNGDFNAGDDWSGTKYDGDDYKIGKFTVKDSYGSNTLHIGGGIWWKPSDVFKIDVRKLQDEGVFGKGNYVAWGYHANSAWNNAALLWNDYGWHSFSNGIVKGGNGFYGGSDAANMSAGLTFGQFGDLFTANLVIPLEGADETTAKLFSTHVQFLFNIDGVGEIALSYAGGGANPDKDGKKTVYGGGSFFINADLSQVIPGSMGLELGVEIPINGSFYNAATGSVDKDESKKPIRIGLGFGMNQWTSEAFQLFSRVGVVLIPEDNLDHSWMGTVGSKGNLFAVDINPSIQIGDVGRVFFDFGVGYAMFDEEETEDQGKSALVWHFNPYLRKSIGIGDLYIGFNVWNNKIAPYWYEGPIGPNKILKDDFINFSLPIFFEVSF